MNNIIDFWLILRSYTIFFLIIIRREMQCGISWMNKKIVLRFKFKVSNKVMMQSFYYLKRGNNIFFFI